MAPSLHPAEHEERRLTMAKGKVIFYCNCGQQIMMEAKTAREKKFAKGLKYICEICTKCMEEGLKGNMGDILSSGDRPKG